MDQLSPPATTGIFAITRKTLLAGCGIAFVLIGLFMICQENWQIFPLWLRAIIGILPWFVTMGWVVATLRQKVSNEIAEYQGFTCVIGWLATLHLTEQLVLSTIPDYWVFFFFSLLLAPILLVRHSDSGFWVWVFYSAISQLSECFLEHPTMSWTISILWNLLPLGVGFVYFLRSRQNKGWQAYLRTMLYAGGIALYCSTACPINFLSLQPPSVTNTTANLAFTAMVTPLLVGAYLERQGTFFQRHLTIMGVGALLIILQAFSILAIEDSGHNGLKLEYILLPTLLIVATLRWTWHSVGKLLPFIPLLYIIGYTLPGLYVWTPLAVGAFFVVESIHVRDRLFTNLAMVYAVLATACNTYFYFDNFTLTLGGLAMILCGAILLGVNCYFNQLTCYFKRLTKEANND